MVNVREKTLSISHWLLLSACFSGALLSIRILATKTLGYIFLPWNLFLAFIPFWIMQYLTNKAPVSQNKYKVFGCLVVWLLFIPNSFYIITDLFHFARVRTAPKWFDLLLIFSFAWNGIVAGIISVRKSEIVLSLFWKKKYSPVIIFAIMWLNALGINVGRFLRFNSWDIITDPLSLAGEILDMVIHPFKNGYAWGMTLGYGIFMTVLYMTFKKVSEIFYSSNR